MQKLQRSFSSPAKALGVLKSVVPGQHVAQSNPLQRSPSFRGGVSKLSGILGMGSRSSTGPGQSTTQKPSQWSKVQGLFKDKTLAQRAQGPQGPQVQQQVQNPKPSAWSKIQGLIKDKTFSQRAQGPKPPNANRPKIQQPQTGGSNPQQKWGLVKGVLQNKAPTQPKPQSQAAPQSTPGPASNVKRPRMLNVVNAAMKQKRDQQSQQSTTTGPASNVKRPRMLNVVNAAMKQKRDQQSQQSTTTPASNVKRPRMLNVVNAAMKQKREQDQVHKGQNPQQQQQRKNQNPQQQQQRRRDRNPQQQRPRDQQRQQRQQYQQYDQQPQYEQQQQYQQPQQYQQQPQYEQQQQIQYQQQPQQYQQQPQQYQQQPQQYQQRQQYQEPQYEQPQQYQQQPLERRNRDQRRQNSQKQSRREQGSMSTNTTSTNTRSTNVANNNNHHVTEENLAANDSFVFMWKTSQIRIFEEIISKFLLVSGLWGTELRQPDTHAIGKIVGYLMISMTPNKGLDKAFQGSREEGCVPGSLCTGILKLYPGLKYPVDLHNVVITFLDKSEAFAGMHDVRDLIVRHNVRTGAEKKLRLNNVPLRKMDSYVRNPASSQDPEIAAFLARIKQFKQTM